MKEVIAQPLIMKWGQAQDVNEILQWMTKLRFPPLKCFSHRGTLQELFLKAVTAQPITLCTTPAVDKDHEAFVFATNDLQIVAASSVIF